MWRAVKYGVLGLVLTLAGMAAYGQVKPRLFPVTPPPMVPVDQQADAVFVDKSDRVLQLLRDDMVIREYRIALSRNPLGHKTQEGDYSTPVGTYEIDWRNARSIAHLSLHISYPNEADRGPGHRDQPRIFGGFAESWSTSLQADRGYRGRPSSLVN